MEYDHHEAMKLANQLCFPLYAAARNVTGLYTPWLKPLGLTYTQYIALLVLWEQDGQTVGEIGEKLMLDNGTLSPLLKKMEQAGLVQRQRSREDERVVVVSLTEAGRALREKAKDVPAKAAGCIDLPPEKAQMLYALLYELLENQKKKERRINDENSLRFYGEGQTGQRRQPVGVSGQGAADRQHGDRLRLYPAL